MERGRPLGGEGWCGVPPCPRGAGGGGGDPRHSFRGCKRPMVPTMPILVIEDDPSVLRSHMRLLEQGGFEVLPATNGMEAFEHLRTENVDAILCDVDMPTLSGTGFFEQLEELQPDMASRVVFVTGHADEPETRRFLEQTGQPFLGKPTQNGELVAAIRRIVERRGSGGYAPTKDV